MTTTFYAERRHRVAASLPDEAMLILFSGQALTKSHDAEYQFHPNRNFLYLTGLDKQNMVLVMQKQNEEVSTHLFIERPEPDKEKWTGFRMRTEEAKSVSGISDVQYVDSFEAYLGRQFYFGRYRSVYLDFERLQWDADESKAAHFAKELQQRYAYLRIDNIHPTLAGMRTIKSDEEIEKVKRAISITYDGIDNLIRHAKPGMKEYELQAHYDYILGKNGEREPAFDSIVASGSNAVVLHYVENSDTANDGDLVLLDMGAQSDYYSGDISRTFPVNGKFTERQRQIYDIVLKAQLAVIQFIEPGLTLTALNEKTKQVLAEELQGIGLIQNEEELSQYYYHGVSHHMGLDTHDACNNSAKLQPGMIVTVEPGLYIAEEGIGIRIEDDVLVTETGCEVLSSQIPKAPEEIEAWVGTAK
ncbi:aminopeptidase P family protein [Alicyclobacillus sp. SO9]|uniref:aminopeptidase P family protein n=1 Tax=Alicyclobacillus sp. SO9 TaxID=2665646 RepID=UPI0018E7F3DE|nr:aminopeptidase P family protein [Alicyclobacillus sp. SO9]QQE80144.1 aminopeptidase P family protein [Alicyclobacillus sp. SO9]